MPVQQLSVEAGLLFGKDLLVVAATASGKTFIGEMAGLKNYVEGRGRMLFLVPLVALAVQKHQRFAERYGPFAKASLQIGAARIRLAENRGGGSRDPRAALVVGTYEGVDHQNPARPVSVQGRHGRDRRDPDARGPRAGPPARRADRAAQAPLPAGPVPLPLGHDRLAEAAREEARCDPGPVREPARAARPPPGLRRAEGEDPHDQAARGRGVPARSRRRGSTARRSSSRTRAPAATRWPSSSGRRRGRTMPG